MQKVINQIISYFGTDGLLHIIVSAAIAVILRLFIPVWLSAVITMLIGIAKELVWDYALKRGTPQCKDIVADIIGIIIGIL